MLDTHRTRMLDTRRQSFGRLSEAWCGSSLGQRLKRLAYAQGALPLHEAGARHTVLECVRALPALRTSATKPERMPWCR